MSSNHNKRTYNSIYLKKTTYNSYSNGTIIKRFKVKKGKHEGKIARVIVTTNSSGDKVCNIKYSSEDL